MKLDISRLKKRIQSSSSRATLSKGESLYRGRNVNLVNHEPHADKVRFSFQVKGSRRQPYDITIDINKSGSIGSHCTCPYNYGDTCKHEVAAFLYLIDHPEFKSSAELEKEKELQGYRENGWYHMPKVQVIDELVLHRHVIFDNYEIDHFSSTLLEQKGRLFKFLVEGTFGYDWEGPEEDEFIVHFEISDQGLKTKCSCEEDNETSCEHQAHLLFEIEKVNPSFFVNSRTAGLVPENIKQSVAKNLKMNTNQVDKYVRIYNDIHGYTYKIKDEYVGIVLDNTFQHQKDRTLQHKKALGNEEQNELEKLKKRQNTKPVLFLSPEDAEYYPVLFSQTGQGKVSKKDQSTLNKPTNQALGDWMSRDDLIPEAKTLVSNNLKHLYASDYHYKNSEAQFEAIKRNFFALEAQFENKALFPYVWLFFDIYKYRHRKSHWIHLSEARFKPVLEINKHEDVVRLKGKFMAADKMLEEGDRTNLLTPITLLSNDNLYLIQSIKFINHAKIITDLSGTGCLYENFPEYFNQVIAPIAKEIEIKFGNFDLPHSANTLKPLEKSLYISEFDKFLLFKPVVKYKGKREFNPLEEGNPLFYEDGKIISKVRDKKWEEDFIEELQSLHPKFKLQGHKGFFNLSMEEFIKGYWFLEVFETLKAAKIEVYGLKDLKNFKYATTKPQISLDISSGMDWFDVDLKVEIENEFFTLKDLKRKLVKSENFIKLGDGRLAVLPEEWVEKIQKYLRLGELNKEGQLQVSKKKFAVLEDTFDEGQLSTEILAELAEKQQRLKEFKNIKNQKLPKDIKATLRNYQIEGFNWLCFLDEFGWGGILADDMGLGKTVQVITFILHRLEQKVKKPILVVVPTSLIFNWKNEIEKFAPTIKYYLHYGSNRSDSHKDLKSAQLIVTSYGLMYNDLALLKKVSFDYVILDESQAIKNASTSRFKAAIALKANNRLAMTGTPIENNTFELFAQMHFTNPGFLGSAQDFKQTYTTPIDKYGDENAASELQKLTNPFILRRTKEIVAKELPPKTEDIIYCEMEPSQKKVYEAYRNQMRLQILDKIEEEGVNQTKLVVLQALTKLRQICDSPLLLSGEEEGYEGSSVKLDMLLEHINEKTSNHKILIFSQFVKMLGLIKDRLVENKIPFEYLDGGSSSKQRESSVKNFQDNQEIRVFLISLKAGGTGLNLTAADYVYVVDPWWNPAVENQAIDRCYRIGQDKHVIAYRMICKDTIEDKIQQYKAKKQQVADSIITTDENMMANLQQEDIMDLFG